MATNAPSTRCWCGRPNEYRVVEHYRPPGTPIIFGQTDWQMVPHDHTQAEVDAWLGKVKVNAPQRPFCTKIEDKEGEMTDDLVQRLRGFIAFEGMSLPIDLEKAVREAAVTIERLQADNAALQKQVAEVRNKALGPNHPALKGPILTPQEIAKVEDAFGMSFEEIMMSAYPPKAKDTANG